jgi:hypothetical protein
VKVAFGLLAAPPPDRFLVALAVLDLLSDAASERPVVCLIDDEQWLDKASVHALAFVARRLEAEAVGIVFAGRRSDPVLDKLPELVIEGLDDGEARTLLESSLVGPLDPLVREQLVVGRDPGSVHGVGELALGSEFVGDDERPLAFR